MRVWRRRAEAWLSGLRTWQFVLIWDGSVVAGCTVGALLGEWAGGHPFNPSTLVGTATGSLLAATVFAFVARRRMQDRAERGNPCSSDQRLAILLVIAVWQWQYPDLQLRNRQGARNYSSAARPILASWASTGRARTSPMSFSAPISSSTPSSGASRSRLSRMPRYSSADTARRGSLIGSSSARNRVCTEVSRASASAVSSAAVNERWPRSAWWTACLLHGLSR